MIWFVGAGPGDPELITIKGRRLLGEADVVVWAGSLVPEDVLAWVRDDAKVHDSAGMHLDEIVAVMASAHDAGRRVVRLHTGDPSLYGAIGEQMARLDDLGIEYEIVPGVSSFAAAAAAVRTELTLPDVSQTLIITRTAGRTPVPEREELARLAEHRATMAVFLSAARVAETAAALQRHYDVQTPVAVVQRASWPQQQVVRGTLETIAEQVAAAGIDRTAMILVGDVLANSGTPSRLYDRHFSHEFRAGRRDEDE